LGGLGGGSREGGLGGPGVRIWGVRIWGVRIWGVRIWGSRIWGVPDFRIWGFGVRIPNLGHFRDFRDFREFGTFWGFFAISGTFGAFSRIWGILAKKWEFQISGPQKCQNPQKIEKMGPPPRLTSAGDPKIIKNLKISKFLTIKFKI